MSRRTQKNVGIIGLGIIGRRVADNLRRRGFHVFVWNRTARPFPNFVGSPGEVAELCDFVQIFVSDDDALLEMVRQMKQSLGPHHVVMAHSTVAPHTMRAAAEIVQRRGAHFLDAPFTGSKIAAEKGELAYYVAGDEAASRRARPVLEASSKEIIEIGEIGQATTVKLATNMVTAAAVQAAAEALALVHNAGLAPEKFAAALRGNASNSGTLTMKLPKMIEGDFEPHFSVKHMLKDVQIAARLARSYGLAFGATEAARDSLLEEIRQGRADQDYSSLVRFFFPEGLPRKAAAAEDDEEQPTLAGIDSDNGAGERRGDIIAAEAEAPRETEKDAAVGKSEETARDATAIAEDIPDAAETERVDEDARKKEEAGDPRIEEKTPEAAAESTEKGAEEDNREPVSSASEGGEKMEAPQERDDEPSAVGSGDEGEGAGLQRPGDGEIAAAEDSEDMEESVETPTKSRPADKIAPERLTDPETDIVSGEPPREIRVNREAPAATPPAERSRDADEVAVRRSFLSRMFGKGADD